MLVLKLASVENTCVELDVGYKIIFKKPFKRTLRVNYSRKNRRKFATIYGKGGFADTEVKIFMLTIIMIKWCYTQFIK